MALFKIKKGLSENLPSTYVEGYCYFTTDDGKFYIDTTNTQTGRIVLNAEKADKDGDGNIIKNTYLPLTGGTLTGVLDLPSAIIRKDGTPDSTQTLIEIKTLKNQETVSTSVDDYYTMYAYSQPDATLGYINYSPPHVYRTIPSGSGNGVKKFYNGTIDFKLRASQYSTSQPYKNYYYTYTLGAGEREINFTTNKSFYISYIDETTAGNSTTPVYKEKFGKLINCSQYAGGTAVTLNGESKGAETASFYAPTTAGAAGQYLKSNGSGAPTWAEVSTVGLTHIGNSQPTDTDYVLWVDTDEPDAVIGYEIYTGPSQPTEESYDLWIDTSKNADVALPASQTMRKDAIKYKTFSIATSAWSGSGPYTYQMTANGITANTAILNLTLDATSQTYQKAQLDWETGANFIKLSTATKPTGTISGYLIATEVTVI